MNQTLSRFQRLSAVSLSIFLSMAVQIANAACDPSDFVSSDIAVNPEIPRIAISRLTNDPYVLIEGAEALSSAQPATVITYKGDDLLVAVDAQAAYRKGPSAFLKSALSLSDSAATNAWLAKVESRFAGYMSDDFAVSGLASLWTNIEDVRAIDRVFFARFYDTHLENFSSIRPDFFVGADKSKRILLISLKVPGRNPFALPAIPSSAVKTAGIAIPPRASARPKMPGNIWFQLPRENGKPNYVTWDVPETGTGWIPKLGDRAAHWAKIAIPGVAAYKRVMSGKNDVEVARFTSKNSKNAAYIYEISFIDRETYKQVSIKGMRPASVAEALNMEADFVTANLDPSDQLKSGIWLPRCLPRLSTGLTGNVPGMAIDVLKVFEPDLMVRLAALPIGANYLTSSGRIQDGHTENGIKAAFPIPPYWRPRKLLFHKDLNGRVFLVGVSATEDPEDSLQ